MRKVLAVLLSVILALSLPMSAFAATQITLRIIPGAELLEAGGEQLQTMFESLYYRILLEGSATAFSVHSDKGELISVNMRSGLDGFYCSTALVGDRTLYFSTHDVAETIVQDMQSVQAGEISEAELFMGGTIVSMLPSFIAAGVFPALYEQPSVVTELIGLLPDSALLMGGNATVTEGDFIAEDHDPATTKTEYTRTAADLAALMDNEAFRKLWNDRMQLEEETAAQVFAGLKEAFSGSDFQVAATVYTNGDRQCAAHREITYSVVSESASGTYESKNHLIVDSASKGSLTTHTLTINNTTLERSAGTEQSYSEVFRLVIDSAAGTFTLTGADAKNADRNVIQGQLTIDANGMPEGWFGVLEDGYQFTATLKTVAENQDAYTLLSLYETTEAADTLIEPAEDLVPMLSFAVQVAQTEAPEALTALAAATPESCLQLLRLPEAALAKELDLIEGEMMSALLLMMSRMPPELLTLTLGTGYTE